MTTYAKILITGTLLVKTGLHIGTDAGFSAIGATDLPVVRDPDTKLPLIPGSSIKGKMRTLLARQLGSDAGTVAKKPDEDDFRVRRLFGDTNQYMTGRLVFRDAVLSNWSDLETKGARTNTEVKFENTIDRVTAVANPRQVERVLAGSTFDVSMVYEVSRYPASDKRFPDQAGQFPSEDEIREDFQTIATGLRLLELDYLGGHGTRGYGRIQFTDLAADARLGELTPDLSDALNAALKGVTDARSSS